jgi:hypothetical protein
MPLAPKPKAKKKTPVKTYTQAEVEAMIRKAYKDAGADLPTPANRRKMMEQMQQAEMDKKMKAATKRAGVPMKNKKVPQR